MPLLGTVRHAINWISLRFNYNYVLRALPPMHFFRMEKYEQYFKDHNRVKEFSGHSAKVHSVAWSCDGKRLASGSLDKTACVFTLDKDRLVKGTILSKHILKYWEYCFYLGYTSKGYLENSYKGHGDAVDQLVWHPTNPMLFATASGDKTVRIWDVRTAKAAATINTKGTQILLFSFCCFLSIFVKFCQL